MNVAGAVRITIALLALSLFAGAHSASADRNVSSGNTASPPSAGNTIDKEKLMQLKKDIEKLKQELNKTKGSRSKIQNDLENTEKSIGSLSEKAKNLEQQLQLRKQKIEQLKQERKQLEQDKQQQQKHIGEHINASYKIGQQSSLRMLLSQQNPATVARNLKYHQYIVQARADQIKRYTDTLTRIQHLEPEIAQQAATLQQEYQELEQHQLELHSAQRNRKRVLATLNAAIADTSQDLRELQRNRQSLENVLGKLSKHTEKASQPSVTQANARQTIASAGFRSQKGKLALPTKGKIIRRFGSVRVPNKLNWEGLLIQAPAGKAVYAVHHGRVVFSDYLRGHGLLIIVDHGAEFLTLYAHNEALYKDLGEWVEAGESIASVGNSGGQQANALYFELRYKGQPQNPRGWFRSV